MVSRRQFGLLACALVGAQLAPTTTKAAGLSSEWSNALSKLEKGSGGRLGGSLLDLKTGNLLQFRGDERFPMCSTFKVLAAAAVLKKLESKLGELEKRVSISQADIVENSPVTSEHVGANGLSLRELCDAALTRSDNTAGNLLLNEIGGPAGLTKFAQALGDDVTRLDRTEPTLNEALRDDLRDTTSPNAMVRNLKALLLGEALSKAARVQLTEWMVANKTGDTRLRAGLPAAWRVADKTGAGEHGTTNDIAVIWRPNAPPLILAAYLTGATIDSPSRNEVIAEVAREAAKHVG